MSETLRLRGPVDVLNCTPVEWPQRSRPRSGRASGPSLYRASSGSPVGGSGLCAITVPSLATKLVEPRREQILRFCAKDPVERVFLEDVARRGLGRFVGLADNGELRALCHLGVNVVPSGAGCGAFAREATRAAPRMVIGEALAVTE